jgi:hypothetical protein
MLISHELETRILNINYLLKQLDVTAAQRGQLLRLLENAESELLEVFGSDDSAPIAGESPMNRDQLRCLSKSSLTLLDNRRTVEVEDVVLLLIQIF